MERISNVKSNLTSMYGKRRFGVPGKKSPDDVVIISCLRTPLTRSRKGYLKDTSNEILLAHVLKAVIKQSGVRKCMVEDIQVGNVLMPGAGAM